MSNKVKLKYIKTCYEVEKVTLGVFENNESAYHCYQSVGFQEILMKKPEIYSVLDEEWKCLEMEILR